MQRLRRRTGVVQKHNCSSNMAFQQPMSQSIKHQCDLCREVLELFASCVFCVFWSGLASFASFASLHNGLALRLLRLELILHSTNLSRAGSASQA